MTDKLSDDWYCPTCEDYVSGESVTFKEEHVVCGTFIGEVWQKTEAALLAMLPFAQHDYRCEAESCICGYDKALAALPEHLRAGESDE